MFEVINAFLDQLPAFVQVGFAVVTGAAAIAAVTPTQVDNQLVDVVLRVLNILGGNFGQAKNADDKS